MKRFPVLLLVLFLAPAAAAQEAKSLGRGDLGAGFPQRAAALVWNPAALALSEEVSKPRNFETGFTAEDATNTDMALLDFDRERAADSPSDPVRRLQRYEGFAGFQFRRYAVGVLYDQTLNFEALQDSLDYLRDRSDGSLPAGRTYSLSDRESRVRVNTVALGWGQRLPSGQFLFLAAGGSLKFHSGMELEEVERSGTLTVGSGNTAPGLRRSSTSGRGLSYDAGILAQVSEPLFLGLHWENLDSDMKWDVREETFEIDGATGVETTTGSATREIRRPFDRTLRVGITWAPPGKGARLGIESVRRQGSTRWRFGFEQFHPRTQLAWRAGTFQHEASGRRVWTVGGSWVTESFSLDAALLTRSFPDVLDSTELGGGFSASMSW